MQQHNQQHKQQNKQQGKQQAQQNPKTKSGPVKQTKEVREDRSKSFGESFAGRQTFKSNNQQGDKGIIPKENSFPEESREEIEEQQPEDYNH